jgi:hypothetical protein
MAHDGTGDGWDPNAPADSDALSAGAQEIRDLRRGVQDRLAKEHVLAAPGDVGGEHKNGSAIAYFQNTYPTLRPDGTTAFTSADKGRILVRSDNFVGYVLNAAGTAFVGIRVEDGGITQGKIHSTAIAPAKTAILLDQRSDGTQGGAFNSGAWHARELNTTQSDPVDICVIESDSETFSLNTGTFRIWADAPAYQVDNHQIRLYQTTGTPTTIVYGTSEVASVAGSVMNRSYLVCDQVSGGQSYQIQHRCAVTKGTNGRGIASTFGGVEIYTRVIIEKIAP